MDQAQRDASAKIAVIGMAGRFPGARSIDEYWANLVGEVESIHFFTDEEWDAAASFRHAWEDSEESKVIRARAVLEDADHFDAEFFGYQPREAAIMDPQQRLFLEQSWAALEHAGYDPARYDGAIGVYGGVSRNTYLLNNVQHAVAQVGSYDDRQTETGNERDYVASRVAYQMDLHGPAVAVHSACSTSLLAIHYACQDLLDYQCDIALAGGASVRVPQVDGYVYSETGILSRDGRCRPFDRDASGMNIGDGVGLVVLKRLDEAIRDGDMIWAVVAGSAVNNDGRDKLSFMAPSVEGQAEVIAAAMAAANIGPDEISYVECHGTGTPLGDPIEVEGLRQALQGRVGSPCMIGSVKSNVGHLDAASGVAGFIKVVLALHHKQLPATLHYRNPNPECRLDDGAFGVVAKTMAWNPTQETRRAGVSSFGVGGTNVHAVLEEAPSRPNSEPSDAGAAVRAHLLPLSARTESSLIRSTTNLADHLDAERPSLADVAYTLQEGRRPFDRRTSVVATSIDEAVSALRARASTRRSTQRLDDPSVAFLFPGGGSQHVGMAAALYRNDEVFRAALDQCAEIMRELGQPSLLEAIYPVEGGEPDRGSLERVSIALPALFSVEYALARTWQAFGVQPSAMIGHSLGEYVAATLGGVFSLESGLSVVVERSRLMEEAPRGAMVSVALPADELGPYLSEDISLAVVNTAESSVLSGSAQAVKAVTTRLEADGVDVRPVPISVASHSVLMEPLLDQYRQYLDGISMERPRIPLVSNTTGTWIGDDDAADPAYWVKHLRNTVRFAEGLDTLLGSGAQVLVEVGPSQVLSGLVRRHPRFDGERMVIPSLPHPSQDIADDRHFLASVGAAWEAGVAIDWGPTRAGEGAGRVGLPTYAFDRQRHWIEPTVIRTTGAPAAGRALPRSESTQSAAPADAPSASTPVTPLARVEYIARRLVAILSDLSGVEESSVDREATFLELGFDSLFLTQANSQFRKTFGLSITFRQLFDDAPTVTALSKHIDANLPPDALQQELAAAQPRVEPSVVDSSAVSTVVPSGDFEPESVGDLLDRTMQQLQLVRSALVNSANAPIPQRPRLVSLDEATVPKVGGTSAALALPAAPASPAELTPTQRMALDDLIERYAARTRGSKEWADRVRPTLADNRAVAGFDRLSKELTYLIVAERSKGAHIWDIDGNDYVDLTMCFGAALLGHSPDDVVEAVGKQLSIGYQVGIQSPLVGEVAELLCEITGNERVTFAHSGSEAVEYAVRMARAVTGRDRVAYFSGDIHGRIDIVLGRSIVRDGNVRTLSGTSGIPDHVAADGLVLEYGSLESLELIRAHADQLAAVLVEPVRTRNPDLQPAKFLQELRAICDASGSALIFDEVVTGFRVANGGAQEHFGIRADMVTYGKALGGGMPIGAVAGKREYLDVIDGGAWRFGDDSRPEVGMTVSGGTMIKHPIALAAAKAVLESLRTGDGDVQRRLNERTERFAAELNEHYRAQGIPIHLQYFSSFFLPTFTGDRRFEGLFFAYLRERGVHIYVQYPCFLSAAHSDADLVFLLDAFKAVAAEMVEAGFLQRVPEDEDAGKAAGAASLGYRTLSLTDAQRDIWVVARLGDEASAAYHPSEALRLQGELDVGLLERALDILVERHESLRITFDPEGAYQLIHDTREVRLPIDVVADGGDAERRRAMEDFLQAERARPFDLVQGPLFRARLVRMAEDDHTLILTAHHIVSDGWSLGILQRDLAITYSALRRGETVSLEDTMQFSDYVAWYAEQTADAEAYWLDLYSEPPRQLDLPTDHPRPPVRSFACAQERATMPADLIAELRQLAAAQGVTLFTVLMASWQLMLHRLSGQDDVPLGIFVAGQSAMGVRDLTGLCVNFLPLRSQYVAQESAADYLDRLKLASYDAYDHQHYTVGRLAAALHVPRDPSRPTVVSSSITYETPTEGIVFEGLEARPTPTTSRYCAFDLEAYLTETDDGIDVMFQYASALFESDTIQRWLGYYVHLLRQMTSVVTAPVSELRLLDDRERHELLVKWNDTESPIPDESIHEQFERQADRYPDRLAIRGSGKSITYRELNATANRLARHLRHLGVGTERRVGVHLDRSPDMVVALLAVHKAGGAFVPLDPMFPAERLAKIAEDAGLHTLITEQRLADDMRAEGAVVVMMDGDASDFTDLDDSDLGITPAPSDLAYIISTSGSTGRPKGVEIEHLALVNQLTSMLFEPGLVADDVVLAVTTISFDPALLEIFLPLMVGATIVLADAREAVDGIWLRDRLAMNDITVMQGTPATWQMVIDAGWSGTPALKALCGGEALTHELAAAINSRVESLWNVYGTTETTIWSSTSQVSPDGGLIPLGPPIANTEFHVLDPWLEPQPPGVVGGLHIGGVGLARGYRNQPGLTEDRFIMHRFDDEPPRRLYRTGDLARRLADGRIEFLGRDDFQVKIRGFRIELGEIETALARHPGVRECAVDARPDANGTKRLVAYLVPASDSHHTVSELRMYLRESLPDYMVPSAFVVLDALPLSPNKKVDRARLPDPDSQRPDLATPLVEPRTETEKTLVEIWERLLGVDQVGVDDSFFDLGGDSLLALRSIIQANRFGMNLTPISIFKHQTVAELARVAEASSDRDEQGVVTGPAPLTPAQLRFLNERGTPDPHHWNIAELVQAPSLSASALRAAVAAVLAHHDSLRLRLWRTAEGWRQEVAGIPAELPFESHVLANIPLAERSATIERTCAALQASFDLETGPLLKVAHFDGGTEDDDRLFVVIHHFAVDGMTWSVFWEDFEQAYLQAVAEVEVTLPPKTTSFQAWATQLERLAQMPRVADTADEWLAMPWNAVARLPLDYESGAQSNTNDSAAVATVDFDIESTRRIHRGQVRPEIVIMAALARCLRDWTGSPTVLFDILSHGRDAALEGVNLARTVGFTLSYNPLVLSHPTWAATPETLEAVTTQIDRGPEGFSFELLRFLGPDLGLRDRLDHLPRAEVLFNYAAAAAGDRDERPWTRSTGTTGPSESPRGLRQHPLAVRATLTPNLRLDFVYSTRLHQAATIEAKAAEVAATIKTLLEESVVKA